MSANNKKPETISLCDMVDDLVHDESEINEDQNNVDLSLDDSNQPFTCNRHSQPHLDMVFENLEVARAYYNAYARRKGFSIRVNHTRKNKDKIRVGIEYVCSKEGFRRQCNEDNERTGLERAETRVGCKVMIGLKKVDDTWIVCKFVETHNHELLTPKSTSLLRGHRVITSAQKNLIDTLNESGIAPGKIMFVLSKESGGDYNVGCIPVDIQNYLGSKKRKLLQDGDAQGMYKYFIESQCKNPSFVYAIEVDEYGCMGVNHHHQFVMFGCSLLVNETTKSYSWLLKTWLNAMPGNPPSTIITDDDKTMAKAIADEEFYHCIHDTITIEEFELEWSKIMEKYGLGDNDWHILVVFVKKSLVDFLPSHYILERWTINAKKHIVHDISSDVVQVEPQVSSTMMRYSLMLQFLEVAEVGSQSEKQYKHLGQTLRKVHEELLAMQDVHDVDDLESPDNTTLNNQVLSNLPITLRDPPHVPSKGRPKALRQKHPKEKQLMKKRKCSICKETGHGCCKYKLDTTLGVSVSTTKSN
ncbi:protein FAR1-RELATED SEQUENCE 5-like [Quercus lobata]|uniref:protein FAR1-RELATED SEQUENCE 5-like n=1 Tax=Quercus lobata TaxID=97700 RepID=UPI0012489F3F|nr:protein FAR1-RELATED SEQUENCE 5-like [Quercus lobata]